jgi:hypothetical protein
MVDNKENNTSLSDTSVKTAKDDSSAQPENASCPPLEKRKRTVGNKIFDWGVYSSIAWVGVSVMSLLTAHEAIRGTHPSFNWLRTIHKKLSSSVSKLLSSTVMKNSPKADIEAWSEGTGLYYMLGLGGTTLMAPIKWLEDNREKLAAKIDKTIGTTPPDPACIKEEPKQSWGSVLSGRALSVIGVGFGTFVLMGPKRAENISKWFGEKFTNSWMKMRPNANKAVVREWADMGAFDVLFTAITAAVTYAFSRFVATKSNAKKDAETELYELNPSNPQALLYTHKITSEVEAPAHSL